MILLLSLSSTGITLPCSYPTSPSFSLVGELPGHSEEGWKSLSRPWRPGPLLRPGAVSLHAVIFLELFSLWFHRMNAPTPSRATPSHLFPTSICKCCQGASVLRATACLLLREHWSTSWAGLGTALPAELQGSGRCPSLRQDQPKLLRDSGGPRPGICADTASLSEVMASSERSDEGCALEIIKEKILCLVTNKIHHYSIQRNFVSL